MASVNEMDALHYDILNMCMFTYVLCTQAKVYSSTLSVGQAKAS